MDDNGVNMGKKKKKPFYKKGWFWAIIIIIGIGAALGSEDEVPTSKGSSNDQEVEQKENKKEEKSEEVEEVEEKTEFKIGEVISYKDFDLIFENKREISSITGNDKYLVFDVTITSKKEGLQFFGEIQGVNKDNEVINNTIPFVSEDLGDPITTSWTKKLNSGQKAKGYVAFDKEIEKMELRSNTFKNDAITIDIN